MTQGIAETDGSAYWTLDKLVDAYVNGGMGYRQARNEARHADIFDAFMAAIEPMRASAAFRWNGDYDDFAQVEPFYPAFVRRLRELEAGGQYRFNDSFKGHVGVDGPDEDTAIYLLQGLERQRQLDVRIAQRLADGHEWIDALDTTVKCHHVALVPTGHMGGEWATYNDARIVPDDGKPYAVLPKGKRTNGHAILGRRVLALRVAQ